MFGVNPKTKEIALQQRKKAGILIQKVLLGELCVRVALLDFPKDVEDISVKAAWHALCHFEADEDIRAKDSLYAEEQDLFLHSISQTLISGEALPLNITNSYKKYYDEPLTPHSEGWRGFLADMKSFLVFKK